jgi:hypothetical protein
MKKETEGFSLGQRQQALAELQAELRVFSHDGLVQLVEDLRRHAVPRGSWTGCVMSYKRGCPGSSRRDRKGRARNAFTILWDHGWLTDEEVAVAVLAELTRRVAVRERTRPVALPMMR